MIERYQVTAWPVVPQTRLSASDVCLEVVGQIPLHSLPLRPILCFLLSARWAAAHARVSGKIPPALTANCVGYFFHLT